MAEVRHPVRSSFVSLFPPPRCYRDGFPVPRYRLLPALIQRGVVSATAARRSADGGDLARARNPAKLQTVTLFAHGSE